MTAPKTMKAMVLSEPDDVKECPLVETDMPVPIPGKGEILLHVNTCGVCHTDLHLAEGELTMKGPAVVPGHQIVAKVAYVGEDAGIHKVGDRVGVTWLNSSCGECEYCLRGNENLCEEARFTGLDAPGGYAEYSVVKEEFAFKIPDIFSDEEAAPLLCAGVIGYRSIRLSGIAPGEKLGLYGFGASAHIAIQIARHMGCDVYVFTRDKEHQHHAKDLGAKWVGSTTEAPPEKLDSSIIFAPAGWIVPEALRSLRRGGTLAINAVRMSPIPEIPYEELYWEKTVRTVANLTRQDASEFLRLAEEIPIRTDTEVHDLSEANEALKRLKLSQVTGAAVLRM